MAAVAPIRQQVQLGIGKAGLPVGSLVYVRQGRRSTPPLIELERIYQASRWPTAHGPR